MWPRQESNLDLELRKLLYYPLYYEAFWKMQDNGYRYQLFNFSELFIYLFNRLWVSSNLCNTLRKLINH